MRRMKLESSVIDQADQISEAMLPFENCDIQSFWTKASRRKSEPHFFTILNAETNPDGTLNISGFTGTRDHGFSDLLNVLQDNQQIGAAVFVNSFLGVNLTAHTDKNVRQILVMTEDSARTAFASSALHDLTAAEQGLAVDLLTGLTLRESAMRYGIGYETRRTQLKALTQKFGVTRQPELVRVLLASILSVTKQKTASGDGVQFLRRFMQEYLPPEVRLHVLQDRVGEVHRILDFGPTSGVPVLVAHPPILPSLGEKELAKLAELGQRWICPLRHGTMTPSAAEITPDDYLEHAIRGLEMAHDTFINDPCIVLSIFDGAPISIEFYKLHREKISKLALVSVPIASPTKSSTIGRMVQGFLGLANTGPALSMVLKYIASKAGDLKTFEIIMCKMFSASEPDLEILKREFSGPDKGKSLRIRFVDSFSSFAQGFNINNRFDWSILTQVTCPLFFLHGEHDSLHDVNDVSILAASVPGAEMFAIPDCGTLVYRNQFFKLADLADHILNDKPLELALID